MLVLYPVANKNTQENRLFFLHRDTSALANELKDAAPHVRLCGEFTAQPHVRCTCGKRAVWIFFWGFLFLFF
jgi:hypothetical protein